ncbi:PREDICTED: putative gustatory receptor 77a [Rhagoletis zephyria]|uniref:putative gustatory receptor 77a n=1 Tax=Rhagoletis zephyria TaxID=28612 RepID=UPI00081143F6|nr:PREDICTED: putative gustatory receptor 77a [Rhagoletis zephyria]
MLANFCLLIWGTHFMEAQLCSTRYILTEGSFELPLPRDSCSSRDYELQLEAVLAEFALYLRMEHQQQHRDGNRYVYFMVCGLFALERRLIFMLFETILNYLIILIQYDKVA